MAAWLPLLAATFRSLSLPGWIPGPLCVLFLPLRIAAWERRAPRWADYAAGGLFFGLAFSFLGHVHWTLPAALAAVLGLWWVAEGILFRSMRGWLPPSLAGPLAICSSEWLRALWPMGGVPWALLPAGLAGAPPALFLARAVGEGGLLVLVALWGGWVYALARRRSFAELAPAPVLTALASAAAILAPGPAVEGPPVRCLAIQPDIPLERKHDPLSAEEVLSRQFELGLLAVRRGARADLLLWAETMHPCAIVPEGDGGIVLRPWPGRPEPERLEADLARRVQADVAREALRPLGRGALFVAGAHAYEPRPEGAPAGAWSPRRSEAVAFDATGRIVGRSGKSRLVPFGEVLPFRGRFPAAGRVALWIYERFGLLPDFDAPELAGPMSLPWGDGALRLGVAICWENAYEAVFRRQAVAGAESFVVLSNEAWYGTSAEMDQMVAATRFRAAETGRAVLRVTNNGLTVLVTPTGEVAEGLPRGEPGWLMAGLPRVSPGLRTAYLRGGWLVWPVAGVLGLAAAALGWLRRRLDRRAGHG